MKVSLALVAVALLGVFSSPQVEAASRKTWICLKNETGQRKLVLVDGIDNHDWDGFDRPDHNWNGVYVEAGQTACQRAEINEFGSPRFSFIINSRDSRQKRSLTWGDRDLLDHNLSYRWIVNVGVNPSSSVLRGDPSATESTKIFEVGYDCDAGSECYLFRIDDVP